MMGMAWIAVAPVPITTTRLPAKSTRSLGQRPVTYHSPRNFSIPGKGGT